MDITYEIELDNGAKYLAIADDNLGIKESDCCIIKKDNYQDYGKIIHTKGDYNPNDFTGITVPTIIRKANFHDESKAHENIMMAKSALRTTENFVEELKLDMKLLNAHYTYDKKLITIQFTADGRVDFRELVKKLTQSLNTRIELRQIGVRDETAIIGGLGVCGQELCCSRFLKDFASINVKMAKEQDLSLNPSSISGACGRLKCCLKYEHEGYLKLSKEMPRKGARCTTPDGTGKIVDRNLLSKVLLVRLDHSDAQKYFMLDEVTVKGKQKKNEEPSLTETEINQLKVATCLKIDRDEIGKVTRNNNSNKKNKYRNKNKKYNNKNKKDKK
jgi:cell fate regulator YaaT (PSP1 superfamily)